MTGIYIMLGGMVLFASIIGIFDLIRAPATERAQTLNWSRFRIPKQEGGTLAGIYVLLGGLGLFTLGVLIFDLVTRPPGRRNAHK